MNIISSLRRYFYPKNTSPAAFPQLSSDSKTRSAANTRWKSFRQTTQTHYRKRWTKVRLYLSFHKKKEEGKRLFDLRSKERAILLLNLEAIKKIECPLAEALYKKNKGIYPFSCSEEEKTQVLKELDSFQMALQSVLETMDQQRLKLEESPTQDKYKVKNFILLEKSLNPLNGINARLKRSLEEKNVATSVVCREKSLDILAAYLKDEGPLAKEIAKLERKSRPSVLFRIKNRACATWKRKDKRATQ